LSPRDGPIDPQPRLPATADRPEGGPQAGRRVAGRDGLAPGQYADVRVEVRARGAPDRRCGAGRVRRGARRGAARAAGRVPRAARGQAAPEVQEEQREGALTVGMVPLVRFERTTY